jgi:hypothetical protein
MTRGKADEGAKRQAVARFGARLARKLPKIAVGLIIAFLGLEVAVRVYIFRINPILREVTKTFRPDAASGFSLAPNRHLDVPREREIAPWTFDTNADGLRGPELLPRVTGECRLLAVGGSYVYRIGVNGRDAAPAVLEARVHAATGKSVRIINAGAPAFGLREQLEQYRARGPALDVDGVFLIYPQRDDLDGLRHFKLVDGMLFTDPLLFGGHPSFVIELVAGDNIYVRQSSEALRHFFKHTLARRPDDVVPRQKTEAFDPAEKSWEAILEIEALARERRQPFLLANVPYWEKRASAPASIRRVRRPRRRRRCRGRSICSPSFGRRRARRTSVAIATSTRSAMRWLPRRSRRGQPAFAATSGRRAIHRPSNYGSRQVAVAIGLWSTDTWSSASR